MSNGGYLSAHAAARLLGVDQRTLVKWIRRGAVKAVRAYPAAHWRIPLAEIRRLRPDDSMTA